MNIRTTVLGGALLAAVLIPGIACADFVLDTGTPGGSGAPEVLSTAQYDAAEFSLSSTTEITNLAAYLTQGSGQPNDSFTFDIYSSSGFTGRSSSRVLLDSVTGIFAANGWNGTAVNWSLPAGSYWVALQVSSTAQTKGLDLPTEASASTGTLPALGFAYLGTGTNSEYTQQGALPFGVQISEASPVPLPAAAWLLGSGLLGMGALVRRRWGA